MQLSVIILNYNVRFFLEQCIKSVQKSLKNLEGEIIVVDNNSQDDSSAMMRELFPDIRYIQNQTNLGFPKGNNIGVSMAKGEYICILNPDTVVAEDTFEKALHFIQTRNDIGILGCKLIDGRGSFLPESKRGIPTVWRSMTKICGMHKLFPNSKYFNGYYASHLRNNQQGEVEVLVGAFMLMKKELYLDLGGFDEQFFMYVEDTDLSYRSLKQGKVNYYFPETAIIHYKGESTVKDKEYVKRFHSGTQIFYQKHFKASLFFELLMKTITFSFLITKQDKKQKMKIVSAECYVVTRCNELQHKLKNDCKTKVYCVENTEALRDLHLHQKPQNIEIIFDGNYLSNKEIIAFMTEYQKSNIFFKIKPEQADFLIGSNDRNSRGEVVLL
ncbi:glycosyltransferase family 2 protein [Myroides indicus]|uniref:GT2 family glycosyltransferase n=1 Tax=Myroides indicus TaxID=1323422 RepID=A0A4R7ERZ8_9FLAO|nr:glycosyltransferase family 2 protein [Myroides indicus]TDS56540.1 GT2 family glycosyltransferase [Myroides indicus]